MLFIALSALYILKTLRGSGDVAAEFRDPSSASNFGCITVAVVLVAAAILPHAPSVALFFWTIGTSGQFVLFLTLFGRWIAEPTEMKHATPAWLILMVGNATATLAGVPLGFHETSWFLLAVGLVSWIAFLPLLLYRLIFCEDQAAAASSTEPDDLCLLACCRVSVLAATYGPRGRGLSV
jgi:tellurite resistance protein